MLRGVWTHCRWQQPARGSLVCAGSDDKNDGATAITARYNFSSCESMQSVNDKLSVVACVTSRVSASVWGTLRGRGRWIKRASETAPRKANALSGLHLDDLQTDWCC